MDVDTIKVGRNAGLNTAALTTTSMRKKSAGSKPCEKMHVVTNFSKFSLRRIKGKMAL